MSLAVFGSTLCCALCVPMYGENPNGKAVTVIAHQSSIYIVTYTQHQKCEDYSTSIVNVCFARAARTHDENDNQNDDDNDVVVTLVHGLDKYAYECVCQ